MTTTEKTKAIKRGAFIVLEGIDGSGTTSQAERLTNNLRSRGYLVMSTCQPSQLPIGHLTRACLNRASRQFDPKVIALLFAADRIDHLETEIKPWLSKPNSIVICDRYVWSSLAYQTLDSEEHWIKQLNRFTAQPDLTIWISVPVEEAQRRVTARARSTRTPEEIYDDADLQQKIHDTYDWLYRSEHVMAVAKIDGSVEPDDVEAAILADIERRGVLSPIR